VPKNLILWCIVPFIIIHSIIPHKEERFLFPVINLIPFILVLAYQEIREIKLFQKKTPVLLISIWIFILVGLILINITGLAAMAFKSAGIGRMEITRYIHQKYQNKPVKLIYCSWSSPYNPWNSIPTKLYQEKNITEFRINSLCDLKDSLLSNDTINLLVTRKIELANAECRQKLISANYRIKKQSIPIWIEKINAYYQGVNGGDILVLYELSKSKY
jgi:GPI mannosyltransferase 3